MNEIEWLFPVPVFEKRRFVYNFGVARSEGSTVVGEGLAAEVGNANVGEGEVAADGDGVIEGEGVGVELGVGVGGGGIIFSQ